MARPQLYDDETLLRAAHEEFIAHGNSATTAAVAKRAGVSEATIFKRFGTKEGLFQAALASDMTKSVLASPNAEALLTEARLRLLAKSLLKFYREIVPSTIMCWAHLKNSAKVPPMLSGKNPAPLRGLRMLETYFESQVEKGAIAKIDTEVLARMMTGTLWQYVLFDMVFDKSIPRIPEDRFVKKLCSNLWRGISPKETRS